MSYNIYLKNSEGYCLDTGNLIQEGGTQVVGGSSETMLNVTYNYAEWFDFKTLNGMSAFDAKALLSIVIGALEVDYEVNGDYWEPTEGNVQRALNTLRDFTEHALDRGIDAHFEVY